MRRIQLRGMEMTRKVRDRHTRRLAGKTPEEIIAFYRAAGEAAIADARRNSKQQKGGG